MWPWQKRATGSASKVSPIIVVPRHPGSSDRLEVLRSHASKSSKILEIGPSFSPIAPKRDGYNCLVVDKWTEEELTVRFNGQRDIDVAKIESVDFVWRSRNLLDDIPEAHYGTFDAVLISHALEHVPNPICLLRSIEKLIKPGGYVTLAVPDKRFCFDYFRPVTTTAAWLAAFERDDLVHSREALFECNSFAVARRGRISWKKHSVDFDDLTYNGQALQDAYSAYQGGRDEARRSYTDCHAWVFTPSSFNLLLNECHALRLISLVPELISVSVRVEFFVHLRLVDRRPIDHHERLRLMIMSAREQAAGFRYLRRLPG